MAGSGQGVTNRFTFSSLPRTERGQPIVMDKDPKGETFLYCHGNSVIIRQLASPQMSDIYTQHSCQVNVAKYSPSGFYIASADKSGKVRIWDTVNKEHILKNEFQPISGPIKDLAWSSDNQRLVQFTSFESESTFYSGLLLWAKEEKSLVMSSWQIQEPATATLPVRLDPSIRWISR